MSDDSKDKFRLCMEKGDSTFNIKFIMADSASNMSSVSYENWFKAKVSVNDGIWIGNGITDQYQLKLSRFTSDMYQEIGDSFGYTVTKGKHNLIKLLSSVNKELEVED